MKLNVEQQKKASLCATITVEQKDMLIRESEKMGVSVGNFLRRILEDWRDK